MTVVLGIDPSARKIALVAHDPVLRSTKVAAYLLYKTREKQTPEALHKALEVMRDFLTEVDTMCGSGPRLAYIEKPLVGRGGVQSTLKQVYVQGIIRAALVEAGWKVYEVHPSTWKKEIGNSRADKSDVARWLRQRWPKVARLVGGDGDLTDAAAICWFGLAQDRKAGRLTSGLAEGEVQDG